ncbi:hypothetical protein QE197_20510 (plasmid) [Arsenophonus nasoniae]|uniref:Lipoprotein n=1 Tax=Arsenophonus nasoniae TaxID=638 RepID=A0A4P7L9K1_9GAMM|nr:hypothetical protein [Arsenophonus nasoniae]QBY45812.1 hypothetical protein ArsFIN_44230 [Arsenophonus nasoniae]WGM03552.1 hypothetical protein QE210_19280 [Arsenophonus nasoniae]WGM08058.1 hypothetical protein QE258_21190 [Arsenophonus nasoniae]WGM12801.1 hypothetical protein QE197_20510 [Arsenophonus nasoniae]WGM17509.1 hypothetical protein QE193_20655 [Arsenophonus nasoniae]
MLIRTSFLFIMILMVTSCVIHDYDKDNPQKKIGKGSIFDQPIYTRDDKGKVTKDSVAEQIRDFGCDSKEDKDCRKPFGW